MRKLSGNERRIVERLKDKTAFTPANTLPNGRRSDARARAILSLYHLGLIEEEYRYLIDIPKSGGQLSYYNRYAEHANVRLTQKGRELQ